MDENEVLEVEEISKEEYDANKEFQFLEDTFNLFLKDEIVKLKLNNIRNVKGWLKYSEHTMLKLMSGTTINLYLMGKGRNILTDKDTWRMIRDCLISADKRKFQLASSLIVRDTALEYKLDFFRQHRRGRIIKHANKESVIELLPDYRIRQFESAVVTVTLVDSITKLSSAVTLPTEQYQEARYQALVDLSRKVKMLEMEKEA